jgi:hypothetical protein
MQDQPSGADMGVADEQVEREVLALCSWSLSCQGRGRPWSSG